jgi:hypothetical protein
MGRNFTGWLEFDRRDCKTRIAVRFMTANRAGETMEFDQESHYIPDASGKGTFSHRFNYMAGRWITVAGLTSPPSLGDTARNIQVTVSSSIPARPPGANIGKSSANPAASTPVIPATPVISSRPSAASARTRPLME